MLSVGTIGDSVGLLATGTSDYSLLADESPQIDIGDWILLEDTPGQTITISVTGSVQVDGIDFFLQVADGGTEAGGLIDGPAITDADIFTGTIFGSNNTGDAGDGSLAPQFWQSGTTTIDPTTVTANGLLATVTIDTTGFFAAGVDNPYDLLLSDTIMGDSAFSMPVPDGSTIIINGRIILEARPVADLGGPYSVAEEGSITLDASASYDPDASGSIVSYQWDLDGDGTFEQSTVVPAIDFSAAGYDGPASQVVNLRVIDNRGFVSDPDSVTVNITNAAPTISGQGATAIFEGGTTTLTGTIGDPSPSDDTFTVYVDWGDGQANTYNNVPSGEFSYTHTYADDHPSSGTPQDDIPISITVTDDDGGETTEGTTVEVTNLPPVITSISTNYDPASANRSVQLTVDFADVGIEDIPSLTVDWGDGTAPSTIDDLLSPSTSFTVPHIYAEPGNYTIDVTVTDDDTGSDSDTLSLEVKSEPPEAISVDLGFVEVQTGWTEVTLPVRAQSDFEINSLDFGFVIENGTSPGGAVPVITAVDFLGTAQSPTVFYGVGQTPTGVTVTDWSAAGSIATIGGQAILLDGIVAYVTIRTADSSTGTWSLSLVNTDVQSAYFGDIVPAEGSGLLTVTDQPSDVHVVIADSSLPADVAQSAAISTGEVWVDEWNEGWYQIWTLPPSRADLSTVDVAVNLPVDIFAPRMADIIAGSLFDGGAFSASLVDDLLTINASISVVATVDPLAPILVAQIPFDPSVGVDAVGAPVVPYDFSQLPYDIPVTLVSGEMTFDDSSTLGLTSLSSPTTELWPVLYDLDDNGSVGIEDLAIFAAEFGSDASTDPIARFADFDGSGIVGIEDLALFAANFGKDPENDILHPVDFPYSWAGITPAPMLPVAQPLASQSLLVMDPIESPPIEEVAIEYVIAPQANEGSITEEFSEPASQIAAEDYYWPEETILEDAVVTSPEFELVSYITEEDESSTTVDELVATLETDSLIDYQLIDRVFEEDAL